MPPRVGSAATVVKARASKTQIGQTPKKAAVRPNRTGKGGEERAEIGTVRVGGEDVETPAARVLTCNFEAFLRLCREWYPDFEEFWSERGGNVLCPDRMPPSSSEAIPA